jgi:hypothetical protein
VRDYDSCGVLLTNVTVGDNGVSKTCDFGLLLLVRELELRPPPVIRVPVDILGSKPTTASDVYPLACIGMQVSIRYF